MPYATSPSVSNYQFSPSAKVYFAEWTDSNSMPAEGDLRDVGNCPEIALALETETLPHNQSMSGRKTMDKKINISAGGTITIALEEMTPQNLGVWALGSVDETAGSVDIFGESDRELWVRIVQDNPAGPNLTADLWKTSPNPGGELALVGEEVNSVQVTLEMLKVTAATDGGFPTSEYGRFLWDSE